MATKRIRDLTTTATSADLLSSRYGVLDTPDITKKLPGNLLGGGGGSGNGIEYIGVATTMTDILSIIDNGKLPVMRVIAGQGYNYYYPSWVGSGLTFIHVGQNGVKVKTMNSQSSGWTDVAGYDTALSSTSSNAVQNSTLYEVIGNVETLLAAL